MKSTATFGFNQHGLERPELEQEVNEVGKR